MMNLQIAPATALLASPTVALENALTQFGICRGLQPQTRSL